MSREVPSNVFKTEGFFDSFVENVDTLVYWSDKCLYKNQGEMIAREKFVPYMTTIMNLNSSSVGHLSDQEFLTENHQ